ncbi:MAG: hypothetical protein P0116_04405 [Candidatus Nitrosocosmicus sp.]|nr:hypothetical protein [Candidatus Nitrosocosmicus sp.]
MSPATVSVKEHIIPREDSVVYSDNYYSSIDQKNVKHKFVINL